MLIIRLAGGLGNQIFQLGSALLLAKANKINKIGVDLSGLQAYKAKHINQLPIFFDFKNIDVTVEMRKFSICKLRLPRLLSFTSSKLSLVNDNNFEKILKKKSKFLLLDGYFQTCHNQESFDNQLKILKPFFNNQALSHNDGCIIHIRGGDFVAFWKTYESDKAFYINAIKKMKNDCGTKKFYVVTDDKNYANIVLKDVNFSFIGGGFKEDFYLIGQYKHRILSSSSFALWASALSNNNASHVLVPKEFTPGVFRDFLLPNESVVHE